MHKRFDRQRYILCWLVWLSILLLLEGCARPAESTATPYPTPDDLTIYSMLTEKYTSTDLILRIYDMPVDETARILRALRSIEPPAGLEVLHEQALDAYQYICDGKLLLPGARKELRAEALFMIDWGIGQLLDYREQLDKILHR